MRNIHGHALSSDNENASNSYMNATSTARTQRPSPGFASKLCSCFRKDDRAQRVDDWQPQSSGRGPVASGPRGAPRAQPRGHMDMVPRRPLPISGTRNLLPPLEARDSGKKCLVLDLDETLVHSSFQDVRTDVDLSHFVVPVEIDNKVHEINVIRRPGLDDFMKMCGELYEVVIFTASLQKYADPVCDEIDTHRVIRHRLFREHCTHDGDNYVKDLALLGRELAGTIIIDNSPISYMYQEENAIPISNFIDNPDDTDLTAMIPLLEALATVKDVTKALEPMMG